RYARLRAAVRLGHDLVNCGRDVDFARLDELAHEAAPRLAPAVVHADAYDLTELWALAEREIEEPSKPWVIPACLRAQEVMAYTGSEGLGKSTFLRQIGVAVASGIHPFTALAVNMTRQRVLY